jgi:hypothetical protein
MIRGVVMVIVVNRLRAQHTNKQDVGFVEFLNLTYTSYTEIRGLPYALPGVSNRSLSAFSSGHCSVEQNSHRCPPRAVVLFAISRQNAGVEAKRR